MGTSHDRPAMDTNAHRKPERRMQLWQLLRSGNAGRSTVTEPAALTPLDTKATTLLNVPGEMTSALSQDNSNQHPHLLRRS